MSFVDRLILSILSIHVQILIRQAITDHFVLRVDLLIRSYEAFAKYRPNPNSMLQDFEILSDRQAA